MSDNINVKPHSYFVGALNAFTTNKDEAYKMGKLYPVETLYPASVVEDLQAKFQGALDSIREHQQICRDLQAENESLKGEVKEWLCLDCNTVFPSESIPNKCSCLICPKCNGGRMPKNAAIIHRLKAENEALVNEREQLKSRVAELEKGLSEISEWTKRYTAPGHPISTVADRLLAASKKGDSK